MNRKDAVKISFCIPTYNHGDFLGAALDSILRQISEEFEIVIVDGASTDNTASVVAEYQRRTDAIVYHRCETNRGIDPDIALAVELARGEYCWLASSDDVIADGAVTTVLKELESKKSIYLGARFDCTKDLAVFGSNYIFDKTASHSWDFSSEPELVEYLGSARCLMAAFAYIGVLIFRKDLWSSVAESTASYGSCYSHAYRLWAALSAGGTIRFVREPIVFCRMDNDNFASRGIFRRFMLDFDGYLGIADEAFGTRPNVRAAFLKIIRREHNVFRLAKFYRGCEDGLQREKARSRMQLVGYSSLQISAATTLATMGPLTSIAVTLRRYVRRSLGSLRHQVLRDR